MLALSQLGDKICIIGCGSSGKSTLAEHLGRKLALPVYHLDLLAHYPHTKWQRRADEELIAAHRKILQTEQWIIEGNYSVCMPERLAKASAIIWLDLPPLASGLRYIRRCFKSQSARVGRLPGARSEFSFFMLRQILINYPENRRKYQQLIRDYSRPLLHIDTMRELKNYYQYWQLEPSAG